MRLSQWMSGGLIRCCLLWYAPKPRLFNFSSRIIAENRQRWLIPLQCGHRPLGHHYSVPTILVLLSCSSPKRHTDLEFEFLQTQLRFAGRAVVRNPEVPNHEGWNYFRPASCNVREATCGNSVWMLDTWAALPLRNFLTQVVFRVSAKCTEKDANATAPMMMGTPTDGLTTHHIFP